MVVFMDKASDQDERAQWSSVALGQWGALCRARDDRNLTQHYYKQSLRIRSVYLPSTLASCFLAFPSFDPVASTSVVRLSSSSFCSPISLPMATPN